MLDPKRQGLNTRTGHLVRWRRESKDGRDHVRAARGEERRHGESHEPRKASPEDGRGTESPEPPAAASPATPWSQPQRTQFHVDLQNYDRTDVPFTAVCANSLRSGNRK